MRTAFAAKADEATVIRASERTAVASFFILNLPSR
jgi:hypothetical protein